MVEVERARAGPPQTRSQPKLAVSAAATPAAIADLRHCAAAFASARGASRELASEVALAVSEATTNAVKYAYDHGRLEGEVELSAASGEDWLEVRIRDRGAGFGHGGSGGLGLGLAIMAALSAELTIAQEGDGTEVRMRFPLSRLR